VNLPVAALHIDLVRAPEQLDDVLPLIPDSLQLSLGVVDGRNVWKNDYEKSLALINREVRKLGTERLFLAPSCSLLHSPIDLDRETGIDPEIRAWMSFAKQKLQEVNELSEIVEGNRALLEANRKVIQS